MSWEARLPVARSWLLVLEDVDLMAGLRSFAARDVSLAFSFLFDFSATVHPPTS